MDTAHADYNPTPETSAGELLPPTAYTRELDRTLCRSAPAVFALLAATGDARLAWATATAYSTWGELSHASAADRMHRLGSWASRLRLPEHCPALPDLGQARAAAVGEASYPFRLHRLSTPPLLVYQVGQVPDAPTVMVGGGQHPSSRALQVARAAGQAAAMVGAVVAGHADDACGREALLSAAACGGTLLTSASTTLARPGLPADIVLAVQATAGGAIGHIPPQANARTSDLGVSHRLLAACSDAAVLCETGLTGESGLAFAAAAVALNLPIVTVPVSPDVPPPVAQAHECFTTAYRYAPVLFGTNARVQERIGRQLAAADVVAGSLEHVAMAVIDLLAGARR